MKSVEPVPSAISDSIISVVVGLIMTVPFILVVPKETLAVNLSFWGIHAIMVQTFLIWRAFRSLDPGAANGTAIGSLFLALACGLVVGALATMIFNLMSNSDNDTKAFVFVLGAFACQSVMYWFSLRHQRRLG